MQLAMKLFRVLVFLILFAFGCNSPVEPEKPESTPTHVVTPTTNITGTSVPVQFKTTAKTPTRELTRTYTYTPEPPQPKAATTTPLPTLTAEEVEARVYELLKTNAGCTLPCWWGITPGVTSTDKALSILKSFIGAAVNGPRYKFLAGDGYFSMKPQSSGINMGFQYLVRNETVSMIYIHTEMLKEIYTTIYDDPFYQEVMSAYILKSMLTKYGKPNQVLIRSFSDLAGEFNPTQVLLYYPDQGIVATYFSQNGLLKENDAYVLPTCPPRSYISLRLFDPESGLTLKELLSLNDSYRQYKKISEATNMDLDTFFETYREYDDKILQSGCPALITPEDIWPSEYHNP